MAQEYIIASDVSENGNIAIQKSVFLSIAQISVKDAENAIPTSNGFNSPVTVRIEDNKLFVDVDIKVKFGANVNVTASLVQSKVYDNITFMTGLKPAEVTVNVVGFEI